MENKLLRVDMDKIYFVNKITGVRQQNYEKDDNLSLVVDTEDINLTIENKCIQSTMDGQQIFQYNDKVKYIIDDGHQNVLVRCGYIILNDYDSETITDNQKGQDIREDILMDVAASIRKVLKEYDIDTPIDSNKKGIELSFHQKGYRYTVAIDTINSLVLKNQQRKINGLIFYPFEKNMDKYGTVYLTIFCQKLYYVKEEESEGYNKYELPENLIMKLIESLNKMNNKHGRRYRFYKFIIKRRINYFKGM